MRCTCTSGPSVICDMFCGVMSTYCTPSDARAASICFVSFLRACTYDHAHRYLAVYCVHKHIEFVEAPDGASNRLPKREEQADGRERLFAAGQCFGVLFMGLCMVARLYLRL